MNTLKLLRLGALGTAVFLAATASCAALANGEDPWRAYERGDFATAMGAWLPRAENGDPTACFFVGLMLDEGSGVPIDRAEAARWYERAALRGFAPAQNNLGLLHYRGDGVERSCVAAESWFRAAAAQDLAPAQCNLAILNRLGLTQQRDDAEARRLLERAAAAGHEKSAQLLRLTYAASPHFPPIEPTSAALARER